MDIKEKRKQYYIENRHKILERDKQYYYDNIEERRRFNSEYWALNSHKYVEKRRKVNDYKSKHNETRVGAELPPLQTQGGLKEHSLSPAIGPASVLRRCAPRGSSSRRQHLRNRHTTMTYNDLQ